MNHDQYIYYRFIVKTFDFVGVDIVGHAKARTGTIYRMDRHDPDGYLDEINLSNNWVFSGYDLAKIRDIYGYSCLEVVGKDDVFLEMI